MKNVAIYMRVSSDRQAREGDSIPAQREALTKYVVDHPDMVLAGEYLDDGISGQKFQQRDELQRMLSDARDGKIDIILFTKLDRFFRSVRHYAATQEMLEKNNVKWIAIWEPMYDTTTPAGQLIVNQMMSFAQFEAQNTGQRINQVFSYKISQGEVISGNTALGHKIENKHIVLSDDAPIVKDLFNHYNLNNNLSELTKYAYAEYGLRREPSTWRRFLKNKKYIGEFRGNKNYCPPIISKELFENVQRKLSMNLKTYPQKRIYLFTGLIRCEVCGHMLTGAMITAKRKDGYKTIHAGYRCHRYYSPNKTCSFSGAKYESVIERFLLEKLKQETSDYRMEVESQKKKKINTGKKKADLEKKISKLKELYINDLITIEEYKKDKERFEKEIEELQKQEDGKRPLFELAKFSEMKMDELYNSFSREEKQFFWRSIVKEIRWSRKNGLSVIFL